MCGSGRQDGEPLARGRPPEALVQADETGPVGGLFAPDQCGGQLEGVPGPRRVRSEQASRTLTDPSGWSDEVGVLHETPEPLQRPAQHSRGKRAFAVLAMDG